MFVVCMSRHARGELAPVNDKHTDIILVMEDDAVLCQAFTRRLNLLVDIIQEEHANWDICYLGYK
jgi:GR25 family glycosyltransferase involved in LPS biosynthesis